jgi:transposase
MRFYTNTLYRLRTVPGIGKILSLVILYEIHDIERFKRPQELASYSRLVKCTRESAGKVSGSGGGKIGNVHIWKKDTVFDQEKFLAN